MKRDLDASGIVVSGLGTSRRRVVNVQQYNHNYINNVFTQTQGKQTCTLEVVHEASARQDNLESILVWAGLEKKPRL